MMKNQKLNIKNQKYILKIKKNEKKTLLLQKSGEYLIELIGEGAAVNIVGAFLGKGKERFNIRTTQHHQAKNTQSDLLIKSVLFGESRLNYQGLIRIEKKAQWSDAYQRNENLVMDKEVRVETKPELEIEANEVRCTHGATIGKIDQEQLFYLRSRGLRKKEAERLIIEGFFAPVFQRIKERKIRQQLKRKLWQNLPR